MAEESDNTGIGKGSWRPRYTRSISFRLSLLVSLSIIIFCAIVVYATQAGNNRLFVSEKLRQWEIIIKSVGPNLVDPLASRSMDPVRDLLDNISKNNTDVVSIYLIDNKNEVFYSTRPEAEGKPYNPSDKSAFIKRDGNIGMRMQNVNGARHYDMRTQLRVYGTHFGDLIITYVYMSPMEKERLNSTIVMESTMIKAMKEFIKTYNYYHVNEAVKVAVGQFKDISEFMVINKDGIVIASSNKKQLFSAAKQKDIRILKSLNARAPYNIRTITSGGIRYAEVSHGIFEGDEKYGLMKARYSLEQIDRAKRRMRLLIIFCAMISITLAVALARNIAGRIARPVAALAHANDKLGRGEWDTTVDIKSGGDEMRFLGDSFNKMAKGLKEREFIKDTFSRYVTKQIADELINNPEKVKVGGHKQDVTVLFSDVRGFTTISEKYPPEQVVSQLNEYLSAMIDVIFKYEGTLDKFIGDAIMAVYGVPISHHDDAIRAAKTAVEMQEALDRLNKKWQSEGKPLLKIGIGINSGEVIAGNIGDIRRMEYTVIGDNVNLASRLESLTKQYDSHIIISQTTYEKVKEIVEVEALDVVKVKGKENAVQIYRLKSIKA